MFAGLAAGGFRLHDPLAPATLPAPGVAEAQAPLAWYDSAAVVVGEDAAWRGFGAALVTGEGVLAPPAGRRPRSVWTVVNGSAALDRNGIFVSRGDPRSWVRGGAVAGRRGGVADLDLAGDHLWTFGAGARRGAHAVEGAFAQRGMGERQRLGFGEAARGESGWGRWAWGDTLAELSLRLSRGHDARESFGVGGAFVSPSRRDAQANVAELEAGLRRGPARWGFRLEARQGDVVRRTGTAAFREAWRERALWAAARWAAPVGAGRLEAQLGGGVHGAPERARERLQLAPGAAWGVAKGRASLRLFGERVVTPVWSDLASGTPAFVQDTWVGGLEARAAGDASGAGVTVLGGSTGNRATLLRYPIRDVSLGIGWRRESSRYAFALASADARARWRALGAEATGYLLARGGDSGQARVDPAAGATAAATAAFRLFAGDLGVRLRGQGAWVGARGTDARLPGLFADVTVGGYATFGVVTELEFGDATLVLRADGLENRRHEETWVDPGATGGAVLARDSGRTFRFEMVWPLFN